MDKLKINTLGGKLYIKPSQEEERKKISEQELKAKLEKEALNDAEKRSE